LLRLDEPGVRDLIGALKARSQALAGRLVPKWQPASVGNGERRARLPLLPQILDTYSLSTVLFYFALLLASFVLMTHVYTFFELLSDIIKNQIPMSKVLTYLFFLTPKLIYDSTPISVLVAVLVTFGVLSAGLFAFDHYYVPEANRRQDALRNEIKNRPVQTYLRPDRKWIFGRGPRIYYYKYFDPNDDVMGGVSVYELDLKAFRLRRHISAERASWVPALHSWVLENGWVRDLKGAREADFRKFQAESFTELDEPPNYFLKEVKQDKQMNFRELEAYIRELRQSGFDTVRLQVQLQKKFSVPLFALIMALISTPFAFLTGSRGAMAGVGVSFGIAIAYWALGQFVEQVGNVNQLPGGSGGLVPRRQLLPGRGVPDGADEDVTPAGQAPLRAAGLIWKQVVR